MSGALGTLLNIAQIGLDFVVISLPRMINTIIPDCAVEEHHSDRMMVTMHPVEMGSNISDHAFMMPFEVTLRWAWSDAGNGLLGGGPNPFTNVGLFAPGRSQQIYEQLQALQQSRQPFTLLTGRRPYENMVLAEMEVTTDQHTANILMVEMRCREVIIVATQETQLTPATDRANAGQASSSPLNGGQKQLQLSLNPPTNIGQGGLLPP